MMVTLVIFTTVAALGLFGLRHYQAQAMEHRIVEMGRGILDTYQGQTLESIEKGQPRTFQRIMDDIAMLDGVLETALYSRQGIKVYQSGAETLGLPFVRGAHDPEAMVAVPELNDQTERFRRRDWSSSDLHDTPSGRAHIIKIGNTSCAQCHYTIDPRVDLERSERAEFVDNGQANFLHRLDVQPDCVNCHTHWESGSTAGFLGVTLTTAPAQAEADAALRRTLYVLLIIAMLVLISAGIIGWMHGRLAQRDRMLTHLSVTDRLTGLNNRLKLDEALAEELTRARRYEYEFAVIMVDVDKFKLINDTHGHHVGDQVLIQLADLLREHCRATDVAGRWGGEEFMLVCPETGPTGVLALAEQLRASIEATRFPGVERVTASFGVSHYRPGDSVETVTKRADEALYRAKEHGRNRVESAFAT